MNKQIKDMKLSSTMFAVPWCVVSDMRGQVWIQSDFSCGYNPGGSMKLAITRYNIGFICDFSRCRIDELSAALDRQKLHKGIPYLPVISILEPEL